MRAEAMIVVRVVKRQWRICRVTLGQPLGKAGFHFLKLRFCSQVGPLVRVVCMVVKFLATMPIMARNFTTMQTTRTSGPTWPLNRNFRK